MELSAVQLFEKLQKQYNNNLPFVAYKFPFEKNIKAVLQKDKVLHTTKDFTEIGFVFAPFNNRHQSYFIPFEEVITCRYSISYIDKSTLRRLSTETFDIQQQYLALIQKTIEYIQQSEIQKIVIARKVDFLNIKMDPLQCFDRLFSTYPDAFCYLWYHSLIGLWMGATPELLCSIENDKLSTMSLAGTISSKDKDAVFTEKEQYEQKIVTNHMLKVLSPLCENLQMKSLRQITNGNLIHLCTPLEGKLQEGYQLKDFIDALHPTPAVCGFPSQPAKDFILNNEGFEREFYTGFLGEMNNKNTQSHLYVNLRCLQYEKQHLSLYIGGGITEQSIPLKEWQETCYKSEIIRNILM